MKINKRKFIDRAKAIAQQISKYGNVFVYCVSGRYISAREGTDLQDFLMREAKSAMKRKRKYTRLIGIYNQHSHINQIYQDICNDASQRYARRKAKANPG